MNKDVPNYVIGKDSPIKLIFPKETKIYPNKIYDPDTDSSELNPEVEQPND